MPIDGNTQVILLLTVSFGKADKRSVKPLTGFEWHRLAEVLRNRGVEPRALLDEKPQDLLPGWVDKTVSLPRLSSLLERGLALSVALEKWERAGLWVIARSDRDYPARLRERLREKRPPVMFGCGSKGLLADGGIAVVGSRDADAENLESAEKLGGIVAAAERVVVSGGSRGIDQRAMFGALDRGGHVVGVLSGGLFAAASSAKFRDFLLSDNLTLVSPFNPESRFDVSKAMGRNKCIYCLSDGAVVVTSAFGKGGTWNGATECLKAGWVPVWVKDDGGTGPGNAELVKKGARKLPHDVDSIVRLAGSAFYDLFLRRFSQMAEGGVLLTVDDIVERLPDVEKSQVRRWLKRGESENIIEKVMRPARYGLTRPRLL